MIVKKIIISKPWERELELSKLDLKEESVLEIGKMILDSFLSTTHNDTSNAAGMFAYLTAVRKGRDVLCTQGWDKYRINGLELIKNDKLQINLMLSSGDDATGIKHKNPENKNKKGNATKKLIKQADNPYDPYIPGFKKNELEIDQDCYTSWIFLYHIDTSESSMRLEISLPDGFDYQTLKVSQWKKRIIFDPIDFEPTPDLINDSDDQELDIIIKRKNNG